MNIQRKTVLKEQVDKAFHKQSKYAAPLQRSTKENLRSATVMFNSGKDRIPISFNKLALEQQGEGLTLEAEKDRIIEAAEKKQGKPKAPAQPPAGVQGQPGQAQKQPGQAQVQPGHVQGQPGHAQGQPGQAQVQPGQAQVQPGQVQGQPRQAQVQPGHAQGQPVHVQKQPGHH